MEIYIDRRSLTEKEKEALDTAVYQVLLSATQRLVVHQGTRVYLDIGQLFPEYDQRPIAEKASMEIAQDPRVVQVLHVVHVSDYTDEEQMHPAK